MKPLLWLLLLTLPLSACPPSAVGESPNGRFRLIRSLSFGDFALMRGDTEVWFRRLRGGVSRAAVSDDGRRVVTFSSDRFVALDEKGRERRVVDPQLIGEAVETGWTSGDDTYAELDSGRVLRWRGDTGILEPVTDLEPLVRRADCLESALRLAILHHFTLPRVVLERARKSRDSEVQDNLAAYERRSFSDRWRALKEGARYRESPLGEADVTGILHESDFLPLLGRKGSDRTAVSVLGRLRSRAAVPGLLRLARNPATNSEDIEEALIRILQDEAASELYRLPAPQGDGWLIRNGSPHYILCEFYTRVPSETAIPTLVELLPASRAALRFQTRVDLGPDKGRWQAWLTARRPDSRGLELAHAGEPSGLLWLSRTLPAQLGEWLLHTPRLLGVLPSRGAGSLSLEGTLLTRLSGECDETACGWDVSDLRVLTPLPCDARADRYWSSRDGGVVAVQAGNTVTFWQDGKSWSHAGHLADLSPDGQWAVLAQDVYQTEARLLHLADRRQQPVADGYGSWRFAGNRLLGPAVLSLDCVPARQVLALPDRLWTVGVTADLRRAIIQGTESFVVWDTTSGKRQQLPDYGNRFDVSASAGQLASVRTAWPFEEETYGELNVADTATGKKLNPAGQQGTGALRFSPDERWLAVVDDGGITVYETVHFRPVHTLRLPDTDISGLAFSPDGRYLAAGMEDAIRVWDLQPTPFELADPELGTELWTGMRLQAGAAQLLSPQEFAQRAERWRREQGSRWYYGPGAARLDSQLIQNVLATAGLLLLFGLWAAVRCRR